MEFLTNWISTIILFVLLAVIIDLLLPNSAIQRYAKMVIGLLLIVIILNPILELFQLNIQERLAHIKIPTVQEKKEVENLIESKKKEIQASQRAYILEEMSMQMKLMVEEELKSEYGLVVNEVKLQFKDGKAVLEEEDLQIVTVFVQQHGKHEQESVPAIKDIKIDTTTPITKIEERSFKHIEAFLAGNWQLTKDKVVVLMEGGEM